VPSATSQANKLDRTVRQAKHRSSEVELTEQSKDAYKQSVRVGVKGLAALSEMRKKTASKT
jgi:hypothetical protein